MLGWMRSGPPTDADPGDPVPALYTPPPLGGSMSLHGPSSLREGPVRVVRRPCLLTLTYSGP